MHPCRVYPYIYLKIIALAVFTTVMQRNLCFQLNLKYNFRFDIQNTLPTKHHETKCKLKIIITALEKNCN